MQRRNFLLSLPVLATIGGLGWGLRPNLAPAWAEVGGIDSYGPWAELRRDRLQIRFRWIPPGQFLIGSPGTEEGRSKDEGPQREVLFEQGFWMMASCVTQEAYKLVIGHNPSSFHGEQLPVEMVSFESAEAFNRALSGLVPDLRLRLPSESEWEYACRAGSGTPFSRTVARTFEGKSVTSGEVNYCAQAPYLPNLVRGSEQVWRERTVNVELAGFRPNAWGLWHMHGNVFEWCLDHKSSSLADHPVDGAPFLLEKEKRARAVRGGAWSIYGRRCRAAARGFLFGAFPHVGFRSMVSA